MTMWKTPYIHYKVERRNSDAEGLSLSLRIWDLFNLNVVIKTYYFLAFYLFLQQVEQTQGAVCVLSAESYCNAPAAAALTLPSYFQR